MPRDSGGNVVVNRQPAVSGQTVLAEQVNVPFADIQAMLNLVDWRDGISPWTGTHNANSFKLTGLADGVALTDAATVGQIGNKLDKNASGGVSFASSYAASATDLSKHIALYGTTYGLSVTENSQNYVSVAAHSYYAGSTLTFSISASGVAKSLGDLQANTAVFSTDGNATGSIWSAWGSTSAFAAIGARIETRGAALSRDFNANANAGEVGTYAMLRKTTAGAVGPTALVAGAELQWTNTAADNTGLNVGAGVWMCMGYSAGNGAPGSATLFKRNS